MSGQLDFLGRSMNIRAPEFPRGMEWLNTGRELSLAELRGKFVLLDFWTYCCINCIHIMPDLTYLEKHFEGQPFVVIGVHSAKFTNEQDAANIRQAILRYELKHPVVNDSQMAIWRSFGVNSWPTLALIDPEGYVVWSASGEGHRATLESLLTEGLALYGRAGKLDNRPLNLTQETRPASPLAFPGKLAVDEARGRLFISDSNHNRIVVTDLSGKFLQSVGDGTAGLVDGDLGTARFNRPQGLALWKGSLLVADTENHALRRVDLTTGQVRTLAGTGFQSATYARGEGKGLEVALSTPWDLAVVGDKAYIAMAGTHQIWVYDLARDWIKPLAGTGREARGDGPFTSAAFAQPSGITGDAKYLYVADSEISSIRRLDMLEGRVSTLAGGDLFDFGDRDGTGDGARLQHPLGVLLQGKTLWIADTYNHKLKQANVTTGEVTSFAGTGRPGFSDGPKAAFYEPSGFALTGNTLYVADTNNHVIRTVDTRTGALGTLELTGVPIPTAPTAGEEALTLGKARIAPGEGKLVVKLTLPAGHTLTEDSPSGWKLDASDAPLRFASQSGRLAGATLELAFEATEGAGLLRFGLVVYHCSGGETCEIWSEDFELPVSVQPGGARQIGLEFELD